MEIDASLPKNERILLAAEQVFTMYGYERTTLDQIIALADVGKGTVYKYFGNKEGLFYKLVSQRNAPFVEALHKAVEGADTFEAKMKAYFMVMIEFYQTNKDLLQIIYMEMMGENNGCTVKQVDGVYQVVPRYSQVVVSEDEKERIMRYFNLVHDAYQILEDLLLEGFAQGKLKQAYNWTVATTHLFFGVAMGIFHYSEGFERDFTIEEIADIIVDRYMYGDAVMRKETNVKRIK